MSKKYYWLKLQKDFFKRHDIRVIESMDNGKDYILFYMKLLVESISHEGALRFSDTIPYDEKMLATITNTNIDVVRTAIKIFTELELMEKWDNGTIFMSETQKMIGSETDWAKKKRLYREKQKQLELPQTNEDIVLPLSDKSIELEKEIELEKNKDIIKPLLEVSNDVKDVVDFWNSLNLINCTKITKEIVDLINIALKELGKDKLMEYMNRYNLVTNDQSYFWSYSWNLLSFLTYPKTKKRFVKMEVFYDGEKGERWNDYCKKKNNKSNGNNGTGSVFDI